MRVLIAEEGVKNNSGHWSPYSLSIVEGLAEIGVTALVAGHVDADLEVREAMPFEPVFRHSRWDGNYEHRPWLERKALVALHNWRLYRDMAAFLERSEPFDAIFCGNIIVYHSFAWQLLMHRFLGKKFHHLILMMVQPAGSFDRATNRYQFPLRSRALAWSLSKISLAGRGRVSLAVETPAAQAEFSALTGRPVNLLHHPVEAPAVRSEPRRDSKILRLVCPGFARYEKGSDILLDAIRKLVADNNTEGLRFVLQWKKGTSFTTAGGEVIGADLSLEKNGTAEFVEEELSGENYWKFLSEADIIVLPYRCNPYTTRLSRVTIEALIVGKPVIYPVGSWLEFAVEQSGTGIGFADGSAQSLAEAILKACSDFETLKLLAEGRATSAAANYSPRRFAESLKNLTERA